MTFDGVGDSDVDADCDNIDSEIDSTGTRGKIENYEAIFSMFISMYAFALHDRYRALHACVV